MKKSSVVIKIIVWIVALIVVGIIGVLYFTHYHQKSFRIGTGNRDGTYYSYINKFSNLADDNIKLSKVETAGSVASVRLLQKSFIDGAIVQNDLLFSASKGLDYFEEENTKDNLMFSAVAGLYTESLQIVTHSDSNINSIEDLRGKRVSVGEEQSGVMINAEQILAFYGLTFEDIECYTYSFSDSAKALSNGEIDAFFCMAGAPTKAISNCADKSSLRILTFDESALDAIIKMYPYFVKVTIPANTYKGINYDIHTLGVRAVLVVSNSRSAEEVKILTEDVIKYADLLNANIVTDGQLTPAEAASDIAIPFHAGAAAYYNEKSITVPVDADSKPGMLSETE